MRILVMFNLWHTKYNQPIISRDMPTRNVEVSHVEIWITVPLLYLHLVTVPRLDARAAAAMAAALFGLSVFLFTENPLKCFIL